MKNENSAEENEIKTKFRNVSIAFIIWDSQIHILRGEIILQKP